MRLSRLSALIALAMATGMLAIGCIQRTPAVSPYSQAIAQLRNAGVPDRFDDELLVDLLQLACESPRTTLVGEIEPLALRRARESVGAIDAAVAALVFLMGADNEGLCAAGVDATGTPAPPLTNTFADVESTFSEQATSLPLEVAGALGLTDARLLSPSTGVLRVEGGTTGNPEAAACGVAYSLSTLYRVLLTPTIRALITGDPEPTVQIAISGGVGAALDSSPGGLDALVLRCLGGGG